MRLFKFLFKLIFGILIFVLLIVIAVIVLITGGKDFDVDKSSEDITSVISTSIYESFQERDGNTLDIKLDEDELNKVLNQIIIDSINADYETEDSIYDVSGIIAVQKAKITISNNKVKVTARIKYAFLKTNFSATGTVAFENNEDDTYPKLVITLTKAKLGHLSVKNPSKYLAKAGDSENLVDGSFVFPLEIDGGFMDVVLDNCDPTISIDEALTLTLDLSSIINEEEKNTVYASYTEGDMAKNTLDGLTLTTTELRISQDDWNGYIMVEDYDEFKTDTTFDILDNSYSLTSTDIYFDNVNKTMSYGINIEGVKTYIDLSYTLTSSTDSMSFAVSGVSINGVTGDGIEDVVTSVSSSSTFVVLYDTLEEAFNNKIDISNVGIDTTTGDFVITCTVNFI